MVALCRAVLTVAQMAVLVRDLQTVARCLAVLTAGPTVVLVRVSRMVARRRVALTAAPTEVPGADRRDLLTVELIRTRPTAGLTVAPTVGPAGAPAVGEDCVEDRAAAGRTPGSPALRRG
jgi:hypothetical protein